MNIRHIYIQKFKITIVQHNENSIITQQKFDSSTTQLCLQLSSDLVWVCSESMQTAQLTSKGVKFLSSQQNTISHQSIVPPPAIQLRDENLCIKENRTFKRRDIHSKPLSKQITPFLVAYFPSKILYTVWTLCRKRCGYISYIYGLITEGRKSILYYKGSKLLVTYPQ